MNKMLVVTDMDKTVKYYKRVLGLDVIMDFGANKTLTGGLALQTLETYKEFIDTDDISFGGNNFELYFEEDDFDKFADNLRKCDVQYVHPVKEEFRKLVTAIAGNIPKGSEICMDFLTGRLLTEPIY